MEAGKKNEVKGKKWKLSLEIREEEWDHEMGNGIMIKGSMGL